MIRLLIQKKLGLFSLLFVAQFVVAPLYSLGAVPALPPPPMTEATRSSLVSMTDSMVSIEAITSNLEPAPPTQTPAVQDIPELFQTEFSQIPFILGDKVATTDTVRVRFEPSLQGRVVSLMPAKAEGIVSQGFVEADNLNWYLVEYEDGTSGWSAADWLVLVQRDLVPPDPASFEFDMNYLQTASVEELESVAVVLTEQVRALKSLLLTRAKSNIRILGQDYPLQSVHPGLSSKAVEHIQQLLLTNPSFVDQEFEATGYYGEMTMRAIIRLQERHNLAPTGVINEETKATIESYFLLVDKGMPLQGMLTSDSLISEVERQIANQEVFLHCHPDVPQRMSAFCHRIIAMQLKDLPDIAPIPQVESRNDLEFLRENPNEAYISSIIQLIVLETEDLERILETFQNQDVMNGSSLTEAQISNAEATLEDMERLASITARLLENDEIEEALLVAEEALALVQSTLSDLLNPYFVPRTFEDL